MHIKNRIDECNAEIARAMREKDAEENNNKAAEAKRNILNRALI